MPVLGREMCLLFFWVSIVRIHGWTVVTDQIIQNYKLLCDQHLRYNHIRDGGMRA